MRFDRMLAVPVALATLTLLVGCAETEPESEMEGEEVAAAAETESSWSYEGETGPESWGDLSEEYATCGTGQSQSPIDIPTGEARSGDVSGLELGYAGTELTLEDTGHGYKATPASENTLTIGEDSYRLLQFHAHTPSEHTVDGQSFPMEVHFVHQNDAGELAVVGVMVEEGAENGTYGPVVSALEAGQGSGTATVEDMAALMPESQEYYSYSGSLTTPPCTEGVRWIVMESPVAMSAAQLAVFEEAHGETNRPVVPLNEREVQYSGE